MLGGCSVKQDGEFGGATYKPLRKNAAGDACVFLDGRLCSIYAARPAQVRWNMDVQTSGPMTKLGEG